MTSLKPRQGASLAFVLFLACAAVPGVAAAAAGQQAKPGTPGAAYLHYIAVVKNADSLKDVVPFNAHAKEMRKDIQKMPADQRAKMLAFIKAMALQPKGAKVLSEVVKGDRATLEVQGLGPEMRFGANKKGSQFEPTWGTITMMHQAGEWKIANQAMRDTEKPTTH